MRRAYPTGAESRPTFVFRRDLMPDPAEYYREQGLKLTGSRAWKSALCPFHNDTRPSLQVHIETGAFRCMACGAHGGDVLDYHMQRNGLRFLDAARALGMTGSAMTESPEQAACRLAARPISDGYKMQALHEYTDAAGKPLHWRIRLKHPDSGEKWIRPMKLNGEGYTLGEPEYRNGKPLYRAHELAARTAEAVIVCEGEWCADALAKTGALATTSGAADSAAKADWRPLAGRRVIIWPDNDEAGRRYAEAAANALLVLGCSVRLVDVPALILPPKGDAVDWLAANPNATVANVAALPTVSHPDTLERGAVTAVKATRSRIFALDLAELAKMEFKMREPLLVPWLHSQDLCMLFAARGIGKTHCSLAIAYAVATGSTFLGWKGPEPRKVLYLDGELPGTVMQERLLMHLPEREPAPGFLRVFTPDLLDMDDVMPDLATAEGQEAINAMIEPDTALVIVDNLSAWARGSKAENDAESWLPIADWALALRRRGIAVLMVHHAGKGGDQRGTSKREDLLDVVIKLSRPRDYAPEQGARFELAFTKARNLHGTDAEGLEAIVETDERGSAAWRWQTTEGSTYKRVVDLAKNGLAQADIARELEINRSNVSRHCRKARENGDLPAECAN